MAAAHRTIAECLDAFAISFLILPSIAGNGTTWRSMVIERYDSYLTVSEEMFEKARLFHDEVKHAARAGSYNLRNLLQQHGLHDKFAACCDVQHGIELLDAWVKFIACELVHAKFM
jgi:hypothetical protein